MKVTMLWQYHSAKKPSAIFTSDWISAEEALIITDDLEKIGRLKEIEFKDEKGTSWSKKELKKLLAEIEYEPQDVTVYFDGGYQKDSKMTGIGVAIYYKQGKKSFRIRMNSLLEELESNNEAEYAAFYEAVNQLEILDVHHQVVTFRGDSQVVLNQLSGEWPCFEKVLNAWGDRIEAKLKKLGITPNYELIVRKKNSEADHLASQALRGEEIFSQLQVEG
ncbi:ribonuclease H family protein [Bacillus cihuensis]|uniref:ribonuclease H family protein n=1 Tax=Bacillus cihuensis TaxID=1208599 RepID=UPI000429605D|nr:ribonuclease H family protein [Bacillus cihuensis]